MDLLKKITDLPFTKQMVDAAISVTNPESADEATKRERLEICRANKCGNYYTNRNGHEVCAMVNLEYPTEENSGCGCFLDSKTGLKNEKCPRGFWE